MPILLTLTNIRSFLLQFAWSVSGRPAQMGELEV
jgi:hypothetical protein